MVIETFWRNALLMLGLLKEFLFNVGIAKGLILGPTLFWISINYPLDFPCNVASYAEYTTFYTNMPGILT